MYLEIISHGKVLHTLALTLIRQDTGLNTLLIPPMYVAHKTGDALERLHTGAKLKPQTYAVDQELLAGNITSVGSGKIRDVYLAEYEGKPVAVKLLKVSARRHASSPEQREKLEVYAKFQHWAEFVAMDAVCCCSCSKWSHSSTSLSYFIASPLTPLAVLPSCRRPSLVQASGRCNLFDAQQRQQNRLLSSLENAGW